MDFIFQTWHWSISGFLIGIVMLFLTYFGKHFGMSSNLRSLCAITGVGKYINFFDWDWKSQNWNFVVVIGAMIGGYVSIHYLSDVTNVTLNPATVSRLATFGIDAPFGKLAPNKMFGTVIFQSPKMISILLMGGVLVGFGSRYAGGCTSGHAISGLSNLQVPSLKAVVGFFIGGLVMVHFIFPLLF